MKTGFKDPIETKEHKPKSEPKDGNNSPWDFRCPEYDQRSSCFVNAGTHYGEGHKQPVGHSSGARTTVSALTKGHVNTMVIDEKG
jgi:hypothetical protein